MSIEAQIKHQAIIDDAQAVLDNIDHVGHDDSPARGHVKELCERIVSGRYFGGVEDDETLRIAGAERMQMDLQNLMARLGLLDEE